MNLDVWAAVLATAPTALLAMGMLPERIANTRSRLIGLGTVAGTVSALCGAAVASLLLLRGGPINVAFATWDFLAPVTLGVYVDSLTAVMLLLISLIGTVIVQFSWRYLDGDPRQGRFVQWMAATLGAVMWLVLARNLVLLTIAWMLTSYSLHQLLTHYRERPAALLAARTKFLISRLGDAFLLAGLALTYRAFGTFEYDAIFASAATMHAADLAPHVAWIGTCFVLGAMTKSAQFPFHVWLPASLETPTPVSALMHAGIINAGGFLVLRLSPLVSLSHMALDLLAAVGAMTALYGAVVMLSQTSVKRMLAYSTVAQMGFMTLQCGLGAFSAALLHIVAHALYKAYAFLNSGSVLNEALPASGVRSGPIAATGTLLLTATLATSILASGSLLINPHLLAAPAHWVLGLVLLLALTQWMWSAFTEFQLRRLVLATGMAAVLTAGYLTALTVIESLLSPVVSVRPVAGVGADLWLPALAGLGFCGLFGVQIAIASGLRFRWLDAVYVHAGQGFYVDLPTRRLVQRLWRDRPDLRS